MLPSVCYYRGERLGLVGGGAQVGIVPQQSIREQRYFWRSHWYWDEEWDGWRYFEGKLARVRISVHFVWRHWRDLRYMFVDVRKQRRKLSVRDNFKTMRKITIFLCFLIPVCALYSTLVHDKNPCFSPSGNSHKYKCELKNDIFKPNDFKDHLSTTITHLWVQLRKNWTKEWDK